MLNAKLHKPPAENGSTVVNGMFLSRAGRKVMWSYLAYKKEEKGTMLKDGIELLPWTPIPTLQCNAIYFRRRVLDNAKTDVWRTPCARYDRRKMKKVQNNKK